MSSSPRPGRRRARSRRRTVLVVAIAVLLLAGAVAGGIVLVRWLLPDEEPTAAERMADCEREHEVEPQPLVESGAQVLRRCAWPPPDGGGDGYHEIEVLVLEQDEGPQVAYTFTGPCDRLAYRLDGEDPEHEAAAGQVVDGPSGGPVELTADLLALVPELSPRTLAVLTTDEQPVTHVRCVS